ncbi:MAG: hypothetical protein RR912_06655 [Clostridium sp.]
MLFLLLINKKINLISLGVVAIIGIIDIKGVEVIKFNGKYKEFYDPIQKKFI